MDFTKKIQKVLNKQGIEESKISEIMELLNAPDEEEPKVDTPTETNTEGETEEVKPEVEKEEVEESAETETETEVETEEKVDDKPEDTPKVEQVETEEPPVETKVENQEVFDFKAVVEEQNKTIAGLNAKISSLIDSLNKTGVLTVVEDKPVVGVDEQLAPAKPVQDDPMSSFLNRANKRSMY